MSLIMMIIKNKTMMLMMLIIMTIDHYGRVLVDVRELLQQSHWSWIMSAYYEQDNVNQHRCENNHFEQDNVNHDIRDDNYDPHEQDKLMFTGFYVEKLHNLICKTFHIIQLGWWRLIDLNPCTVELTFRGYNPVIKQTFYQKSLLNLNGPAKIKYEMFLFHQFFKTREAPTSSSIWCKFCSLYLKTGTNKPTTFGSCSSSLFLPSFNRELNRKPIVDPLTNSFGVLEIIFLKEMCSFFILVCFNGKIVQQFVKVHANGAQRICPVSTQLFLWLAHKHFLFHADFLRRVLSIFSIRWFQHQSHLTIWIKVVLFFWCFLCTRLNFDTIQHSRF